VRGALLNITNDLSPMSLALVLTSETAGIVQEDYGICTVWGLSLEWMSPNN
jgi:hypothetical protein